MASTMTLKNNSKSGSIMGSAVYGKKDYSIGSHEQSIFASRVYNKKISNKNLNYVEKNK